MAIRALNSVVVANYDVDANMQFRAGDALALNSAGKVVPAAREAAFFDDANEQLGKFVGFSADDTARTGNTMILNDPVGSSYVDSSFVLQAANNGFYVVAKRAIGDFQSENVNTVTNPTAGSSGFEGPRRGVGVYNTPGGQFVTDRYTLTRASNNVNSSTVATQTLSPGDLLTITEQSSAGNSGVLIKFGGTAGLGNSGIIVGRVDSHDTAAGLLYFTQLGGGY